MDYGSGKHVYNDIDTLSICRGPKIMVQVNFSNKPEKGAEEDLASVDFFVRCNGLQMIMCVCEHSFE